MNLKYKTTVIVILLLSAVILIAFKITSNVYTPPPKILSISPDVFTIGVDDNRRIKIKGENFFQHMGIYVNGFLLDDVRNGGGGEISFTIPEKYMEEGISSIYVENIYSNSFTLKSNKSTLEVLPKSNEGLVIESINEDLYKIRTFKSNVGKGSFRFLYDGDADTRWSTGRSQKAGDFLILEFKEEVDFNNIVLETGRHGNDYPRNLAIYTSSGEDKWKKVEIVASENNINYTFESKPYRYLKLVVSEDNAWWWGINNLILNKL